MKLVTQGIQTTLAISAIALVSVAPATAQSCAPLGIVDGQGTQVKKTISIPGASVLVRDNWHTDFAIPAGQPYDSFVATITPQNGGMYAVQMALKYPNETADTVFDETLKLTEGRPFQVRGATRRNGQPYQINLVVGGVEAVGNTYTASVSGCQ